MIMRRLVLLAAELTSPWERLCEPLGSTALIPGVRKASPLGLHGCVSHEATPMAKKKADDETTPTIGSSSQMLRAPAEVLYASELEQLIKDDKYDRPPGWRMSARSVLTYICGGKSGSMEITPKYIGHQRLVEIAISTLVTDRSLLLLGDPGTAKSWLS